MKSIILELIRIYSRNGVSTRGMLSFITDRDLSMYFRKEMDYYEFFDMLCDNNVRNIINEGMTEEELEQSNEKIKKRILSITKTSIW